MFGVYLKDIVNLFKMNIYTFFFYTNIELTCIKNFKSYTFEEAKEKANDFLILRNCDFYSWR